MNSLPSDIEIHIHYQINVSIGILTIKHCKAHNTFHKDWEWYCLLVSSRWRTSTIETKNQSISSCQKPVKKKPFRTVNPSRSIGCNLWLTGSSRAKHCRWVNRQKEKFVEWKKLTFLPSWIRIICPLYPFPCNTSPIIVN